jgi:transposase-like protein
MPPVDRNEPVRADYSESSYSLMEFMREFPNDAACLEWLWRNRYSEDGSHAECPKCDGVRKFHKVKERPAWDCDSCGHHRHPLAGTIFHKSSTSLQLWFFAIHLMTSTRCGVSAKQLERELGVTYKTAWRMFNLIRNKLMAPDDDPLSGHVEIDEASVDGKPRKGYLKPGTAYQRRSQAQKLAEHSRATVFAAVERGGRVKATVLLSRRGPALHAKAVEWIEPTAIDYTDEWPAYNQLHKDFAAHSRVRHAAGEYVLGSVHTNTIEGFFGHLEPSIRGTYRKVSHRWVQGYLSEFTFRYNERHSRQPMFYTLLRRACE